jgi:hypothetical protein
MTDVDGSHSHLQDTQSSRIDVATVAYTFYSSLKPSIDLIRATSFLHVMTSVRGVNDKALPVTTDVRCQGKSIYRL